EHGKQERLAVLGRHLGQFLLQVLGGERDVGLGNRLPADRRNDGVGRYGRRLRGGRRVLGQNTHRAEDDKAAEQRFGERSAQHGARGTAEVEHHYFSLTARRAPNRLRAVVSPILPPLTSKSPALTCRTTSKGSGRAGSRRLFAGALDMLARPHSKGQTGYGSCSARKGDLRLRQ